MPLWYGRRADDIVPRYVEICAQAVRKLSQLVTKESTGIHRKLSDHAFNLTQIVTQAMDDLRDVERSIRQRCHEEVYRVVDESAAAVDGLSTEFNVMGNRLWAPYRLSQNPHTQLTQKCKCSNLDRFRRSKDFGRFLQDVRTLTQALLHATQL